MDSAHAEAAVVLINAGADRTRVSPCASPADAFAPIDTSSKVNLENEAPEDVEGVGGAEQKRARQHVIESCGKP